MVQCIITTVGEVQNDSMTCFPSPLVLFLSAETGSHYVTLTVLELCVNQADLELLSPPASASQIQGLKACAQPALYFFV